MNDFSNINGERALLARAAREIRSLRLQNRDLQIRVRAFDDMIACFDKRQPVTESMAHFTSDVAVEIEHLLEETSK